MPLVITTKSATNESEYKANYPDSIYPAFLDNLPYWSFNDAVSLETGWNQNGFQLKATGATGSNGYKWSITGGSLPDGLTMDQDGPGLIYGKPTKLGIFTFTVQVSSPGQTSVSKTISMVADPFRAKWLRDARTTMITHWGKASGPVGIKNTLDPGNVVNTHIPEWMAVVDGSAYGGVNGHFDAEDDADLLEELGMDVDEVSGKWQNHCPTWDSAAVTRYSDHSSRNIFKEQSDAYHAAGKKILSYFAPDSNFYGTPPQILCDGDANGNWASPNHQHVLELATWLNCDGIIFDVGATPEVPGVNAGWINRSRIIAIMRNRNPWMIFGMSAGIRDSGIRRSGSLIAYPHCDLVIYETVQTNSTSENVLEVAVPSACEKEMVQYVWTQVSNRFAYGPDALTSPIKNIDGLKSNMRKNANVGAVTAMALPVRDTGWRREPYFMPTFQAIGEEHKATKNFSEDVQFVYADGVLTMKTEAPAEIYYTTDGSEPTTKSQLYFAPIAITKNTKIRARSLQPGKSIGYIRNFQANPVLVKNSQKSLFVSVVGDSGIYETLDQYRGFEFTVGSAPLILKGVGRKIMDGMTQNHDWILRRRWDEYPIIWDKILTSDSERGGYKFGRGGDIRLEAGMTYVIGSKEGLIDKYASNNFATIPTTTDLTINRAFVLSKFGEFFPATQNGVGQFFNLEYEVLERERSKNVALGASGYFTINNSDQSASTNGGIKFASNAFNGDRIDSYASVGGTTVWTVWGDMREPKQFNRAEIYFQEAIPPNFDILASHDGKNAGKRILSSISGNTERHVSLLLGDNISRYIALRNTSGNMIVNSIELYND